MRQPEWLVLRNVGDFHTELTAVADRRFDFFAGRADNDADFADARSRHGFYSIKQDWFVGDRHELFGARMRNWP